MFLIVCIYEKMYFSVRKAGKLKILLQLSVGMEYTIFHHEYIIYVKLCHSVLLLLPPAAMN